MSVTGERGRAPQRVSTALSDIVTGMAAAIAINAALLRQQAAGRGEIIDVSLLDTDLALMAPRIAAYHAGEPEPAPSGGTDSVLAVYQSFQAADRSLVVAIGNDTMWRRFCTAVDLPELGSAVLDVMRADSVMLPVNDGTILTTSVSSAEAPAGRSGTLQLRSSAALPTAGVTHDHPVGAVIETKVVLPLVR